MYDPLYSPHDVNKRRKIFQKLLRLGIQVYPNMFKTSAHSKILCTSYLKEK